MVVPPFGKGRVGWQGTTTNPMNQRTKAPETELECFHWLEKKGLLHEEYDQYFSPHKAEHRHYSLRYAAAKKGNPQPPGGRLST